MMKKIKTTRNNSKKNIILNQGIFHFGLPGAVLYLLITYLCNPHMEISLFLIILAFLLYPIGGMILSLLIWERKHKYKDKTVIRKKRI